jgi:hypothetical protein
VTTPVPVEGTLGVAHSPMAHAVRSIAQPGQLFRQQGVVPPACNAG